MVGKDWVSAVRSGSPLPEQLVFGLAHEARHSVVGTVWLLRTFRLLRTSYLAVAGAVYTGLLVNVAAIFDDPDRVALTIAAVLMPFVAATLKVVLDAATDAVEWRLELDADAAALRYCRAMGLNGKAADFVSSLPARDGDAKHVPLSLRSAALQGLPVWRSVAVTLVMGWLAAVMPLGMSIIFAWVTTDAADVLNASLSLVYLSAIGASATAILASIRPVPGNIFHPLRDGVCKIWLQIYGFTVRVLGWGMAISSLVIFLKIVMDGWPGMVQALWDLATLAVFTGAAVAYIQAGRAKKWRARWMVAAAVCDTCRLWIIVWLLRASAVMPFFDDVEALGRAMREHSDLIADAAFQMLAEEAAWLTGSAIVCGVISTVVAFLALQARAQVLRMQAATLG